VAHESAGEITRLLQGWRGGDRKALDALLPVVYKELQRLAHFQLRKERPGHTLQSAALVNEAYLRLVGLNAPQWEGRTHFFAIAAQQMRQILVDYARRHRAGKRGGAAETLSLDDTGLLEPGKSRDIDVVALDDALNALAQIDPRKAQVVELRFFGGLNFDETADWTARSSSVEFPSSDQKASNSCAPGATWLPRSGISRSMPRLNKRVASWSLLTVASWDRITQGLFWQQEIWYWSSRRKAAWLKRRRSPANSWPRI
jgi:RNA polymerase sigma-70 factor, ECF subfamily